MEQIIAAASTSQEVDFTVYNIVRHRSAYTSGSIAAL
ncbi:hypothetical protein JOC58_001650 [Paenibacillus hunanensis]|uniref:Uncharacterized protein n=1 Tax=Paenibacillus hunanensis TaxID=539262 RepID=A0ABU1IYJ8_9BACL|nr:hypothetical protein [Paenibacillus hunanensis]